MSTKVNSMRQDIEVLEKRVEMHRDALDDAAEALGFKLAENENGVMRYQVGHGVAGIADSYLEQICYAFNEALDS